MNNLRRLRVRAGISQESLAKELNVSQSMISQLEGGQRKASNKMIKKLAIIFQDEVYKEISDKNIVIDFAMHLLINHGGEMISSRLITKAMERFI